MNGVLIIDKPVGLTSHDVVARVRRILSERRVGHTGTLDPFATGVLVILVGRATKLAQFLNGAEKEYQALIRFGYATDTGDATGTRRTKEPPSVETDSASWSDARITATLESLRGEQRQVPPMYSAKKVGGKKLYELARQGVEIEREAARIFIRELEAIGRDDGSFLKRNEDGTADMMARVVCSAGTYVRVLAETIGEKLGAGAHLAELRRTRAGAFKITDALTLDELQRMAEEGTATTAILSPDAALPEMPLLHLTEQDARAVRHGIAVRVSDSALKETELPDGCYVRMREPPDNLIAVGVYDAAQRTVRPRVLIALEK
ncbi:MAG: tRNA pseudouridine(55) synthase TruB [Pyrinomonadaceae bacterium]